MYVWESSILTIEFKKQMLALRWDAAEGFLSSLLEDQKPNDHARINIQAGFENEANSLPGSRNRTKVVWQHLKVF